MFGVGRAARFTLAMWNPANRGAMADIETTKKRYPTDLTDEERERTRPFLPTPANLDGREAAKR